jgi:hypothetical protein
MIAPNRRILAPHSNLFSATKIYDDLSGAQLYLTNIYAVVFKLSYLLVAELHAYCAMENVSEKSALLLYIAYATWVVTTW